MGVVGKHSRVVLVRGRAEEQPQQMLVFLENILEDSFDYVGNNKLQLPKVGREIFVKNTPSIPLFSMFFQIF